MICCLETWAHNSQGRSHTKRSDCHYLPRSLIEKTSLRGPLMSRSPLLLWPHHLHPSLHSLLPAAPASLISTCQARFHLRASELTLSPAYNILSPNQCRTNFFTSFMFWHQGGIYTSLCWATRIKIDSRDQNRNTVCVESLGLGQGQERDICEVHGPIACKFLGYENIHSITILNRIMTSPKCPHSNPLNLWICYFTWQKGFHRLD